MTILAIAHQGPLVAAADRVYRVDAAAITPVRERTGADHLTTG